MFVMYFNIFVQVAMGAAGGVDLLLGALQAHPQTADLQQDACVALSFLCTHASNKVLT